MSAAKTAIIVVTASLFVVGSGCAKPAAYSEIGETNMQTEKVSFKTDDGVTIVGDVYRGTEGGPAALLLHMMPATKESWRDFAAALVGRGYSIVLAIDFRGHGESVMRGEERLDYRDFEDVEHQAKRNDVAAAVKWLESQGVPKGRLAIVGASIGANLAIAYGADNQEIPAVVALSPGLNYRGITTEDKMSAFVSRPLLVAASAEDGVSFETDRRLVELKTDATVKELSGAGHGTTMFEKAPGFMGEVIDWVVANNP